jgi:hypothetical protein
MGSGAAGFGGAGGAFGFAELVLSGAAVAGGEVELFVAGDGAAFVGAAGTGGFDGLGGALSVEADTTGVAASGFFSDSFFLGAAEITMETT